MLGIIIQARTGSTRLPGKMLASFYQDKSLIDVIIERIKSFGLDAKIILATTSGPRDEELVKIAEKHDIAYYKGSENDVLQRFIDTAEHFGINKIIRVCADNPFLDAEFFKQVVNASGNSDYCSFYVNDSKPTIQTHYGFFAEYVRLDALKKIRSSTQEPLYREHVTNYIYSFPQHFSIKKLAVPPVILENTAIRLTIDTQADFDLCKAIYAYFCKKGKEISAANIIEHIKNNKDYQKVMQEQIKKNGK